MRKTRTAKPAAQTPSSTLAQFLGSGACIIDYNSDGKPDIFLADADGRGNSALYKNIGAGKFLNVTREAHLEIHGQGKWAAPSVITTTTASPTWPSP